MYVDVPPWLSAPASAEHRPPVVSQTQLLPLDELSPRDFERLSAAVARADDRSLEACRLYGLPGQRQDGIDIYGRAADGTYTTYQCKRYEKLWPSTVREAVARFREGEWLESSDRFVLCTSATAADTAVDHEIHAQRAALTKDGVQFEVWDVEELSQKLKDLPQVVFDFFGRAWVEHFCRLQELPPRRLDADAIVALRRRLHGFYAAMFARHDVLASNPAPDDDPGYVALDVLARRTLSSPLREVTERPTPTRSGDPNDAAPDQSGAVQHDSLVTERLAARRWVETNHRLVVIGDAGTGKSTMLRELCLDLSSDEPTTTGPLLQAGAFLPVWVPFGRLVGFLAGRRGQGSVPAFLESFFVGDYAEEGLWELVKQGLGDERLVLVVDGLDEWSDEDNAYIAADRLLQYLAQHELPVVVGTRPEGRRLLAAERAEWAVAELAPLSGGQQEEVLRRRGASAAAAAEALSAVRANPRLRRLAENPLLLSVLWELRAAGETLPDNAQSLLAQFVTWLIQRHGPARRRAGQLSEPELELEPGEVEEALESLALDVQGATTPATTALQATRSVQTYLLARDDLALTASEARKAARALVHRARGSIGLLGEPDDEHLIFVHRALQEHLAGRGLAALPVDEQAALLDHHAASPGWRGTLEALLWTATDSPAADLLLDLVEAKADDAYAPWAHMPLLAQLAVGDNKLSAERRDAALLPVLDYIELPGHEAERGECLDAVVGAVIAGSPPRSLHDRMRRWTPSQDGDRSQLLRATARWVPEAATEEMWWRALLDENVYTARTAGQLLAERFKGDQERGRRLVELLGRPMAAQQRAQALDLLLAGWPECDDSMRWQQRALEGEHAEAQLIALLHLVRAGKQRPEHRDLAIALADESSPLDHRRSSEVAEILVEGWRADPVVLEAALRTVDTDPERPLGYDLGIWWVATSGSADPRVRKWMEAQFDGEFPLNGLSSEAWVDVGRWGSRTPWLRDRLEALLVAPDAERGSPDLCNAALGLQTEPAKRYLLQLLANPEGFPSVAWPFTRLQIGWPDDPKVQDELRRFARSGDREVADLRSRLWDVLPAEEAEAILFGVLGDQADSRGPGVLRALAEHVEGPARERAYQLALAWHGKPSNWDSMEHALLAHFGEREEVRALARAELARSESFLPAVAFAAQHDAELRASLVALAAPLPSDLRRQLARRLFEARAVPPGEQDQWLVEDDELAASTRASLAAVTAAGREDEVIAKGRSELRALGFQRDRRRQAAVCLLLDAEDFAGLAEGLGEEAPGGKVHFGHIRPNWWMAARTAAHFDKLQTALPTALPDFLGDRAYAGNTWNALAPFAASSRALRQALLAYLREHASVDTEELLRFAVRELAGTQELTEVLLEVVGRRQGGGQNALLAVDFLVELHGGDPAVLARLSADARPTNRQLLAMALGWPGQASTLAHLQQAFTDQRQGSIDLITRLQLATRGVQTALESLGRWVDFARSTRYDREAPTRIAMHRTRADAAFAAGLGERLRTSESPSQVATAARLLAGARRLNHGPDREAAAERCREALIGGDVDVVAYDIVELRERPLGWILWESLHHSADR